MAQKLKYHRDDLRADLLAAGLAFVESQGHEQLSVRTLAQKVRVSPGAPYHHFSDRRSLLLALAEEGYRRLMGSASSIVASNALPFDKLTLLAESFVAFATQNPRLLELMYESELTRPTLDPIVKEAQAIGYRALRDTLAAYLPRAKDIDVDVKAVTLWSTLYGFATLRNKNMIQIYEPAGLNPAQIQSKVVRQALEAL